MRETVRLIKRVNLKLARDYNHFAKDLDLTGTQLSILDFIYQAGQEIYLQRDIEQEFYIQRSTATGILQGMEKRDLIKRQISPEDARQRSIHLTDKGRDIARQSQSFIDNQEKDFNNQFSDEDRRLFHTMLDSLSQ